MSITTLTSIALILIGGTAVVWITTSIVSTVENRRYVQAVREWARRRGADLRTGAEQLNWVYQLPHHANHGTRFQINGSTDQFLFTLAYVRHLYTYGDNHTGKVEHTMVVLHLRNAYPAAELEPRRWGHRGERTGHAGFDRKFTVRTDVPGGPAAVITPELANAVAAGDLPRWSVRERELLCFEEGQQRVDRFDLILRRAIRVAELLNLH